MDSNLLLNILILFQISAVYNIHPQTYRPYIHIRTKDGEDEYSFVTELKVIGSQGSHFFSWLVRGERRLMNGGKSYINSRILVVSNAIIDICIFESWQSNIRGNVGFI